jgi:hypothetical protein
MKIILLKCVFICVKEEISGIKMLFTYLSVVVEPSFIFYLMVVQLFPSIPMITGI